MLCNRNDTETEGNILAFAEGAFVVDDSTSLWLHPQRQGSHEQCAPSRRPLVGTLESKFFETDLSAPAQFVRQVAVALAAPRFLWKGSCTVAP